MERLSLITQSSPDYQLLDTGEGEKLERYGDIVLVRPDPQTLWSKHLPEEQWQEATARYVRGGREGEWVSRGALPKEWPISFGGLTVLIRPTSFKHTGLFPEQQPNWAWMAAALSAAEGQPQRVLNLFGYTGGATLICAKAGAEVTHVDASKTAVAWARENAARSGLSDHPIRWIVDDARTFLEKELKRGKRYDAIVLDPPAFGHGPNDELWKIEDDFVACMALCKQLLSDTPLFISVSGYAAGYSALAFAYNLESLEQERGGRITYGDLAIAEEGTARVLPCGIVARWQSTAVLDAPGVTR